MLGSGAMSAGGAPIADDYPAIPHGPDGPIPQLPLRTFAPPAGILFTPAEYSPNDGLLLRWGASNSTLTELISKATQADSSAIMWVVVSSLAQQSTATSALIGGGAVMTRVRFIIAATNSVWMRDYGPRFVINNGQRVLVDHTYNRNRPLDDAFPTALATLWGAAKFDIPLVHGGGNFHLFDDGDAFMTSLIQHENSSLSSSQIQQLYRDYQNVNVTFTQPFPSSFDSTQHIDMWMLPVARKRVILSEYPTTPAHDVPRAVSNQTATDMIARGYTVFRTPGWSSGGSHYTYANAVVLNQTVMLCQFNGYPSENAQALLTYTQAFGPTGRTITTMDCSAIITIAGAIHCIVMHVPSTEPTLFSNGFESRALVAP